MYIYIIHTTHTSIYIYIYIHIKCDLRSMVYLNQENIVP